MEKNNVVSAQSSKFTRNELKSHPLPHQCSRHWAGHVIHIRHQTPKLDSFGMGKNSQMNKENSQVTTQSYLEVQHPHQLQWLSRPWLLKVQKEHSGWYFKDMHWEHRETDINCALPHKLPPVHPTSHLLCVEESTLAISEPSRKEYHQTNSWD